MFQTAILVAFTQLIPEHQVQVFGVVKIRVKVVNRPVNSQSEVDDIFPAITHGICDLVNRFGLNRVPVPVDSHTVRLARLLGIFTVL